MDLPVMLDGTVRCATCTTCGGPVFAHGDGKWWHELDPDEETCPEAVPAQWWDHAPSEAQP
jgi:hypothetical protein